MSSLSFQHPVNWMIAIGLCISLTGCLGSNTKEGADAEKMPTWVMSPPQDNTHLYGVGSAPRIENIALAFSHAEQNGNVQIAQQLRTQVSQVNTQNTQVSSSGHGDEQVSKIQTAYTQITTAPLELEQAVNEQRFAGSKYVYALQSIDRSRIVSKLKTAIVDLDDAIRKQATALTTTGNQAAATQDWQIYMQLIPRFAQRKAYQEELSLYSIQRTLAGRAEADIQAIEQQLNQALSTYGFDVSQTQQANPLASALSKYGLTPKANSVFQLNSQTSQHSETQNGRFYVFEEGTLELIDPTGSRLAAWTVSARGIAKNKDSAAEKATTNWSMQAIEAMFVWLTRLH
ncbi:LPP20 family lipoprotein [Marinomonas transparens]|uniref:LPP20 family lipoprotein n=1 Tax=Marinomonas transparens TaxID=2795388 RepID=A0A934JV79_9GAMM|nr:LPP20 family lipoprotein [Marinomonas transparens]MBJ7537874.1 LPP20 family lipoprotein [Marinomonas transparens]